MISHRHREREREREKGTPREIKGDHINVHCSIPSPTYHYRSPFPRERGEECRKEGDSKKAKT